MTMKTLACITLFAALATPGCVAQGTAANTPFTLPAGEHTVTALIDKCAAHLQYNIVVSEQELAAAQPMTLRLQQPIITDRDGCEDLLTSLLWRNGFALTWLDERARIMEVLGLQGPRGREVLLRAVKRTPDEVLARPDSKMPVSVVVPLQHVNATIASNALRPFFATSGAANSGLVIGNIGNSSTLLITGFQNQVAQALRMVREADVPATQPDPQEAAALMQRIQGLEQRLQALEARLGQSAPKK